MPDAPPTGLFSRLGRTTWIWSARVLAVVFLAVGLVVLPTPIPVGLPMIVIGTALLVSSSRAMAALVREFRRRYPRLDDALRSTEPRIPRVFRAPIELTDPLRHPALETHRQPPGLPDGGDKKGGSDGQGPAPPGPAPPGPVPPGSAAGRGF